MRRTATGDAPLPRMGWPEALVPQPAMLTMVTEISLGLAGPAGVYGIVEDAEGFRNNCRNPITCTGLVGVPGGLLITGIVTKESLTITFWLAAPATGYCAPPTNSSGGRKRVNGSTLSLSPGLL